MAMALLVMVSGLNASAQQLTPEQMQRLQSLSTEQKNELIRMLGDRSESGQTSKPLTESNLVVPDLSGDTSDINKSDAEFAPFDELVIELLSNNPKRIAYEDVKAALGKRVYKLDDSGALEFPGVGIVRLAGLNVDEVKLRLEAEPVLAKLIITVFKLPTTASGGNALQPYGYDLFSGAPTTFAPATDIPIPTDYVVGPGDAVTILIFGQHNVEHRLVVGRDGQLNIPDIGPVAVAGMQFSKLREELSRRIQERYIGVNLSITMGELRSIRVFVLGDVNRPGSYTVSGLSTITNALFLSGGIADNGSLRNVQLKRRNRVVGTMDLYDLLLQGNTKDDRRLQPGDVIYVPPVGKRVSVFGRVNRPAIYELKNEFQLGDVIKMAGGLLPSAYKQEARIIRNSDMGEHLVVTTSLDSGMQQRIESGDEVEILGNLPRFSDAVYLKGHVLRESTTQWRQGMRLLDLVPRPDVMKQQADQSYLLIRRESRATGKVELLSSNWRVALQSPDSIQNRPLKVGDTVYVFSLSSDRAERIAPLLDEVKTQSKHDLPDNNVSVVGRVRAPGHYPFEPGMRVSDLIRASGSLLENAYLGEAEITRFDNLSGAREIAHHTVDLHAALSGGDADVLLERHDVLTIKEIPLWREQQTVEILGEVQFPGQYTIKRGERLSTVLARAGGTTSLAFLDGSIFTRESLREREEENLRDLLDRARLDVASMDGSSADEQHRADALVKQLNSTDAVGRLVIDLNRAAKGDHQHDVILENGDRLIVPVVSQAVTLIGEVQFPTSHIYTNSLDQFAYIRKSGGLTANADIKRIYIVRADGNVIVQSRSNWFRQSAQSVQMQPGDTIVVPINSNRMSNLALWTSVTSIIYNIGVAAAAVGSF